MQGALIRELPRTRAARGSGGSSTIARCRPRSSRDVLAWSRDHGLVPHLNHLERMVVQRPTPGPPEYVRFNFGRVLMVPDLDAWCDTRSRR